MEPSVNSLTPRSIGLHIALVIICTAAHFLVGWIAALMIIALVSGFMFVEHTVTKASILGLVLNGSEILYTFVSAPEETNLLLNIVTRLAGDVPEYAIVAVSLVVPVGLFGIAGFFSSNVAYIKRKLTS